MSLPDLNDLPLRKWLTTNVGIKRWLSLSTVGIILATIGLTLALQVMIERALITLPALASNGILITSMLAIGLVLAIGGLWRMVDGLLAPYRRLQRGDVIDMVVEHNRRQKGFKFVAIGGGTGLPASLRGMKAHTSNITAVVTVGDDGGSSGRLRRDLGVLPPGDLRNNIAALANEDSILTQLFQYRFEEGDLAGHSFGNLFIAALANVAAERSGSHHNSLAEALVEVERVLNIQGAVLPSTLNEIVLTAQVRLKNSGRMIRVRGESQISSVDGVLDRIEIIPEDAEAFAPSVRAIREADIIVIGPGSLYTSILPNLMVKGIADALRATDAFIIYVCNVATQPVETEDYTVADHVMALERHIGRGVFQAVLANDAYPDRNAGSYTRYVQCAPDHHEILQRYDVRYTDLTDWERPWRHDTHKLAVGILDLATQDPQLATIIKNTSYELVEIKQTIQKENLNGN